MDRQPAGADSTGGAVFLRWRGRNLGTLQYHQPVQFPRHADAGERGVGHQRQALACAIIDNSQDAEAAAVGELIRHEVE